jgi:hypothetical protein
VDGAFLVRATDERNPEQAFCWLVTAVRSDIPPVVPEIEKASSMVELLGAMS